MEPATIEMPQKKFVGIAGNRSLDVDRDRAVEEILTVRSDDPTDGKEAKFFGERPKLY